MIWVFKILKNIIIKFCKIIAVGVKLLKTLNATTNYCMYKRKECSVQNTSKCNVNVFSESNYYCTSVDMNASLMSTYVVTTFHLLFVWCQKSISFLFLASAVCLLKKLFFGCCFFLTDSVNISFTHFKIHKFSVIDILIGEAR